MPTVPRSRSEHYQRAEALLTQVGTVDELDRPERVAYARLLAELATAHGLLTLAPRRARKRREPPEPRHHGTSPRDRWLYPDQGDGVDENGDDLPGLTR